MWNVIVWVEKKLIQENNASEGIDVNGVRFKSLNSGKMQMQEEEEDVENAFRIEVCITDDWNLDMNLMCFQCSVR
jgi:hypothetical protein